MSSLPRGPVFFAPGAPPLRRRRRRLFVLVYVAAIVSLIWPGYALVASGILWGWPLALAWNVLWLGIMLGALGFLYRTD